MSRLALMEPNMARLDALEIEVAELRHERDALREALQAALPWVVVATASDGIFGHAPHPQRTKNHAADLARVQAALALSAPMLTDAEKAGLRDAVDEPLPFTDGGHAVCPDADYED